MKTLLFTIVMLAPAAARADMDYIISQFSPDKPHWHEYNLSHDLCSQAQNPKCTREIVKGALLRNVMPCQNPKDKFTNAELVVPYDPNTGCLYTPGHVLVTVHNDVGVVAVSILTHFDHKLYKGVVLRYLEESNGTYRIRTRGIGNNKSDLWAATNKQLGWFIFNSQDARVKKYLEQCMANNGKGCE